MQSSRKSKVALILCDVLRDEFAALTRTREHVVYTHVLEQGLHNTPALLRVKLQDAIRQIEAMPIEVDAIVLGYGLCSRGSEEATTARAKLVLPRAHDCITLLLGSKERYAQYVKEHPGCYWYSPGWNRCHTPPGRERYDKLRAQYVERFGDEDADFLMETEQAWFKSYAVGTYVDTGLTDPTGVDKDLTYTRNCTDYLQWQFDRQQGSPELMARLLDGPWDEADFLVMEPGESARMTADEKVVTSVRLPGGQNVAVPAKSN